MAVTVSYAHTFAQCIYSITFKKSSTELYLYEFGRGQDSFVWHCWRCDYNTGIILLLQTLVKDLHVQQTQKTQP